MTDTREPKGVGPQRTSCATCGWPLLRYPSGIRPRNYCDLPCRDADPDRPKQRRRSDAGIRKSAVNLACEVCGKEVWRQPNERRAHTYCSRQCANSAHRSGGRPPVHGRSHTPQLERVFHAIGRCYNPNNPNYKYYGGRGVTVYGPWLDNPIEFAEYLDSLGPCPPGWSMDRIDNDGNYEPGNIRWADAKTQIANQRHHRKK